MYVGFYAIPGYSRYLIDSSGRVYDTASNRFMVQTKARGYCNVKIYNNQGVRDTRRVHRLVMLTFCPTSDTSLQVNHIDANKSNNEVSNLEWATPMENIQHAVKLGLNPKGERNGQSIFTVSQVREIRAERAKGTTCRQIASSYGCSREAINNIVNGYCWTHII